MSERPDKICLDCGQPIETGQRKQSHFPRFSMHYPPYPSYRWHKQCPVESELAKAGLSKRVRLCLHRAEVRTVEDLTHCTIDDLKNLRGFGKKSIAQVQAKLAALGRSLKQEP